MVILHYTAMSGAEAARDWLCAPASGVSAHYVIARDGRCWQLVDEADRAWHAGLGAWGDVTDVNSRSIGIELANTGAEPFSEPLMRALDALLAGVVTRWRIPPERVLGHSDTALGRKIDPGPRFDWRRLARQGLAIWPSPAAAAPARSIDFDACAWRIGYRWNAGQQGALLSAVRARFRPWASGPITDADRAVVAEVAARWPCEPASITGSPDAQG